MSDVIRALGPQDMQARNQMAQRKQSIDQLRSPMYHNIFDADMPDMQAQMQDLSRAYQAEAQQRPAPGRADDVLAQRQQMKDEMYSSIRNMLLDSGTGNFDAKVKELQEYYDQKRGMEKGRMPRPNPLTRME